MYGMGTLVLLRFHTDQIYIIQKAHAWDLSVLIKSFYLSSMDRVHTHRSEFRNNYL